MMNLRLRELEAREGGGGGSSPSRAEHELIKRILLILVCRAGLGWIDRSGGG